MISQLGYSGHNMELIKISIIILISLLATACGGGKYSSMSDKELAEKYLLQLQKAKSRYIRDQLLLIKKTIGKNKPVKLDEALVFCHTNRIYSARDFSAVLQKLNQDQTAEEIPLEGLLMNQINPALFSATPQKSQISDYESIVNSK